MSDFSYFILPPPPDRGSGARDVPRAVMTQWTLPRLESGGFPDTASTDPMVNDARDFALAIATITRLDLLRPRRWRALVQVFVDQVERIDPAGFAVAVYKVVRAANALEKELVGDQRR